MTQENSERASSPLWILNPDAELELERPESYQTSHATLAAMRENFSRFESLVQEDDSCLLSELPSAPLGGRRALLWCPTPGAVRRALGLGYSLPAPPPFEALTAANNKASIVESSLPAPPHRELLHGQAALARVETLLDSAGALRLKRLFGFAGRRQRKIQGRLRADDQRFIEDGVRLGGLLVENELEVLSEYSIHGIVRVSSEALRAAARLGRPCQIVTDRFGSVTAIERLPWGHRCQSELEVLGGQAQEHLRKLGYSGPFGLDVLETKSGLIASDLNARFTLGFSIGLGTDRALALRELFECEPA